MRSRYPSGAAANRMAWGGGRRWLLCSLLGALPAAALAASAAPAAGTASDIARYRSAVATDYRVIQLSPSTLAGVGINASGQVGFTEAVGGPYRAKFYDGDTIHDIGALSGGSTIFSALNDGGQITGGATTAAGANHAFRWSMATGIQDLHDPALPGNSGGSYINSQGWVAGWVRTSFDEMSHAFRWTPATGLVNLGAFGEASQATAIDDRGTVVGFSDMPGAFGRAFAWTEAGGLQPVNGAGVFSVANDINEAGTIVGNGSDYQYLRNIALLWTPQGTQVDLGAGSDSVAEHINERGLVIGQANDDPNANRSHGFVWSSQHGIVKLGAGGAVSSYAAGLNNRGQVVGSVGNQAIVWTRSGGVVNLNTRIPGAPPGLALYWARAISDNGAIVAEGNTGLVLLVPSAAYHQPPVAAPIALTGATRVNSLLSFSSAFRDVDLRDTHTASWTWGDDTAGGSSAGIVSEAAGTGNVSGQHAYRKTGIYTVRLDLLDSGGKRTAVERRVTICGCGSAVAGQGSFLAPASAGGGAAGGTAGRFAYVADAASARPAAGQAAVDIDVAGLALRSTGVDTLTQSGDLVQLSGSGTVNGKGNYRFTLSTLAGSKTGGQDRVRVRIWHFEPGTRAEVVDYDNGASAAKANASSTAAGAQAEGSVIVGGSLSNGAR